MEQEGFARSSINPFLFPVKGSNSSDSAGRRLLPGL
jgi:hypothetical protein